MKGILQLIGVLMVLLIVLVIVTPKSEPSKPTTKYQECIETSKHLRSERDEKEFVANLCDRVPVAPGDYR